MGAGCRSRCGTGRRSSPVARGRRSSGSSQSDCRGIGNRSTESQTAMLRTALITSDDVDGNGFRIRSREVSRLEGLSDAVFGFAITLLVVSLEVPNTFDELMTLMRGFVAFAASFAVLIMIWYEHYTFFRRYGLEDLWIIVLNSALLFVVVLYIYPLKFMFSA